MRLKDIAKLNSWEVAKISELTFFQEGPGVRKKQYTDEGVKLLNVGNLQEGKLDLSLTDRYISEEEAYGRYSHFLVDEGDLIIACSGIQISYFHEKMAFVKKSHLPLCMNTSTMRFKALNPQKLDINYFSYFLKNIFFKDQLQRLITGSAQLNFGPSHIKEIDLILPPMEIQEKIVKVLDQAQALIDNRKEQIEALDQLIESIFYTMFGNPVRNEKGWEVKKLGTTNEIITGNTPPRKDVENYGNYIEWIKSDNINTPYTYITEAKEYLSKIGKEKGRYVPKNSILMTCIAGSLNYIGNVAITDREVAYNQQINGFIPKEYSLYFLYSLFSFSKEFIQNNSTSSMKGMISKGTLSDLEYIVPPLSLQKEFSQKVEVIEKQKEVLGESLGLMETNYKSIMDKAFKGQLFN